MFRTLALLAAAIGLAPMAAGHAASSFPADRPVRIVAPFVPGGPVDTMARILADKLAPALGTPVIVENRPGAGGNVGSEYVARAAADGHTLLLASGSILTMNEAIYPRLGFSPARDFAPVTLVGDMPLIVAVNAGVPATDLASLAKHGAGSPLFFSSPGNGTTGHAAAALFAGVADVEVTHVPYKGGAESAMAVVSGQVTGAIDTPPSLLPHIQSGKVRALAIAGPRRLTQLPDVPTTAEAGMPDLQVLTWFGLVAPAATPPEVVERINREVRAALDAPDVQERFAAMGVRPAGNSPEDFAAFAEAERERWGAIIARAGIRLE